MIRNDGIRSAPCDVEMRETSSVMTLALFAGGLLLAIKFAAYLFSNSTAILGDAVESVAHVFATAFAFFAMRMSQRPADTSHHYGHAKMSFISQGIEGAMISLAALYVAGNAVMDFIRGPEIERVGLGTAMIAIAGIVNVLLGIYLGKIGRCYNSVVILSHSKHVLTDVWTTVGVLIGLLLVIFTGWTYFDPICAIIIAVVIFRTGLILLRSSLAGLMDEADPKVQNRLESILNSEVRKFKGEYHQLRHRQLGDAIGVEYHLLLPGQISLDEAHRAASVIEQVICEVFGTRTEVITHLEALESHDEMHPPRL